MVGRLRQAVHEPVLEATELDQSALQAEQRLGHLGKARPEADPPSSVPGLGGQLHQGLAACRFGDRVDVQDADVTHVYPVVRAAAGSDEVVRTIVRRETVMGWDDPAKGVVEPGTFSLVSCTADTTNGGCGTSTGCFTPGFGAERAATSPGDGPEVAPYDRSTSMEARMREAGDAECGTATRS
ncbi:hypothetical protein GCM10010406_14850 [Streptomyces thermolineatus]|uniref:Sortase n=1 Tax=Streptomyces thermolineatus TaxID=44033 RepID=A0ABP5YHL1_9ACTN